jgi:Ca2+-binding RTX toxin-like protein
MWAILLSACGRNIDPDEAGTTLVPTLYDDLLRGSSEIDSITGLAGNDTIYGFGGNDQILAGDGDDVIYGGDGDDYIDPGAGSDAIYGEGGNDSILLSSGQDIEDGGDGIDTIVFNSTSASLPLTIDLSSGKYHYTDQIASATKNLISIENIESTAATDITVHDTVGINSITTMNGNDTIHSKGGDDTISTGAGDDTVYLKNGNYTVDLGAGNDTIYLSTSMSIIEGGNGTDTAIIRAFDGFVDVTVDLKFSTYYVQSKLEAQDGQDLNLKSFETITIEGNVAAVLKGSTSADTLVGNDGADTLEGRGGADTLTGGNRQDTFVFSSGDTGIIEAEADTITDFVSGNDLIDLKSVTDGNLGTYVEANGAANDFAAFSGNATNSFSGTAVDIYVEYNLNGGGKTYVFVDENSSGDVSAGDTLIILNGLSGADSIDSSDFI